MNYCRSYGLLRLPKIPETRGVKGKPIDFEITNVDTSKIPYTHKEQEQARLRRLQSLYEAAAAADEQRANGKDCNNETKETATVSTKKFTPHEIFQVTNKEKKAAAAEEGIDKRKRKQKGGLHKKIMDEWDDLAAEEMAYKKFKRGHISKEEYDNCLFSDKKLLVDPITGEPVMERLNTKNDSDDEEVEGNIDSNSDDDNSSEEEYTKNNRKNKQNNKGSNNSSGSKMVLKYKESYSSDEDNDDNTCRKPSNNSKIDYRRNKSNHSFPNSVRKQHNHSSSKKKHSNKK